MQLNTVDRSVILPRPVPAPATYIERPKVTELKIEILLSDTHEAFYTIWVTRERYMHSELKAMTNMLTNDALPSFGGPTLTEGSKYTGPHNVAIDTPPGSPTTEARDSLAALYCQSTIAKIWGVATRQLSQPFPPTSMPEYVMPDGTDYVMTDANFWTSGFFPGSLYLLYKRQRRYGKHPGTRWPMPQPHPLRLQYACRWWSYNLHDQASRTDTHDLGFLIQPWAQIGWELDGDLDCRSSLVCAARALASRFNATVGCIRSWDVCVTKRYSFTDPSQAYLVIIDNTMNLDLLYYAAELTGDKSLADVATAHAVTTLSANLREDGSCCHVVNFDQHTGNVIQRMTNQGFADDSCWSRGQAWGITGYAQCYGWTKDVRFLDASKKMADFFIAHLPDDLVPHWDFNAPQPAPRDVSAALVAAYGMLLLHEAVEGDARYLDMALRITAAVIRTSMAPEARMLTTSAGTEEVDLGGNDTVLLHATINNYKFAPRRWADHGLVYADYYFLLVGNKLLEMGLA